MAMPKFYLFDVHKQDLNGLIAFCEEHPRTTALVISQDSRNRKMVLENNQSILIIPWRNFLKNLWAGDII